MLSKQIKQKQAPKLGRPSPGKRRNIRSSSSNSKTEDSQQNNSDKNDKNDKNENNPSITQQENEEKDNSLQNSSYSLSNSMSDETNGNSFSNSNHEENQKNNQENISSNYFDNFDNLDNINNSNNSNNQNHDSIKEFENNDENDDFFDQLDEFDKAAEASGGFGGYEQLMGDEKEEDKDEENNNNHNHESSISQRSKRSISSISSSSPSPSPLPVSKRLRTEAQKSLSSTSKNNKNRKYSTTSLSSQQQQGRRQTPRSKFVMPSNPTLGDYAREALSTVPESLQKLRDKRKKRLEELRKRKEQSHHQENNNNNNNSDYESKPRNNSEPSNKSIEQVVEMLERDANTEENDANPKTKSQDEDEEKEETQSISILNNENDTDVLNGNDDTPPSSMFRFENGQLVFDSDVSGSNSENGERDIDRIMAQYDHQEAVEENELPHFTSYTNMRRKNPTKRWKRDENELFFKAIRQYGTDFSLIERLFPNRNRRQVRNKFKKEERDHPEKVDWALSNRLPVDEDQYHRLNAEKTERESEKQQRSSKSSSGISSTGPPVSVKPGASGEMTVDELAEMFGEPLEEEEEGDGEEYLELDENGAKKNNLNSKPKEENKDDDDEWDTIETGDFDVIETGFKHGDDLEFDEEELNHSSNVNDNSFQEALDWL